MDSPRILHNSKSQESQGFTAFYNARLSGLAETGYTYLHFHQSIIVEATACHSSEAQRKMVEFQSSSMGTRHASQSPRRETQTQSPPALSSVFLCLFVKNKIQGFQL